MNQTFKLPPVVNYSNIFDGIGYLAGSRVYMAYFGEIASFKKISDLNIPRAKKWIENTLADKIVAKHFKEDFRNKLKVQQWYSKIYVLHDKLLLQIDRDGDINILHNHESEIHAEQLLKALYRFKKRRAKTSSIGLVVNSTSGLSVVDSKIKKPKLSIANYYNDDLPHHQLLRLLKARNKNGLFLFHGAPGTGKSTYIRYLIHNQNKRVIFMPVGIARNLESPEFISLLIENPNTILVIEDAEDLLVSREINHNSGISTLLNLTDGLLGESLGIQVICTFNTKLENIDRALVRKGRLLQMYEFQPLSLEKTNSLLQELYGKEYSAKRPMAIAEIFNAEETGFEHTIVKKQRIGFVGNSVN